MRRFLILLALVPLTGCPQASQFVSPGTFEANNPSPSSEKPSDEKTDDTPVPPPPAPPPAPAPEETPRAMDKVYAQNPIGPKNDTELLPIIMLYTEERLRYDPDHPIDLPKEGTKDLNIKLLLEGYSPGAAPRQGADENDPESFWHPFLDGEPAEGVQIRMIYIPEGKTESDAKFCDTFVNNETLKKRGYNVAFSKLKVGPGEIRFYDTVTGNGYETMHRLFSPPTADFQDRKLKAFKTPTDYQDFISNPMNRELPLVPLP